MKLGKKQYPILDLLLNQNKFDVSLFSRNELTLCDSSRTEFANDKEIIILLNKMFFNDVTPRNYKTIFCSRTMIEDGSLAFQKIKNQKIDPGYYCLLKTTPILNEKTNRPGLGYELVYVRVFDENEYDAELSYVIFGGKNLLSFGVIKENMIIPSIRNISIYNKETDSIEQQDKEAIAFLIGFWIKSTLLFRQFAEFKTKILPPKSKHRSIHCKWKNEFNIKIELCDLNWYTQSIQSHPFVVRGHWRMQPHGKGMKKRKLIWIDEFMKNGYNKGAYMLDN